MKPNRPLRFERLEDRALLAADFGDAPIPYPTTLAENGASHEALGPTLGLTRDTEADGVHSANADADDNAGAPDDENGVTFRRLKAGALGTKITVNVQVAFGDARLDAWIDFDADGNWDDPQEQIASSVVVNDDDNELTFDIPSDAAAGTTFARFRVSTAGNLAPQGAAADGEVEDYAVTVLPLFAFDFGDAPAPYPTTLAENGARHDTPDLSNDNIDNDGDGVIDAADNDLDGFGPRLGIKDIDNDGVHSENADADDTAGAPDDEDGVTLGALRVGQVGASALVHVEGFNPNKSPQLDAWIDFNSDGDWNDAGEQIAESVTLDVSGLIADHTVSFNVPVGAVAGTTFARFRLSTAGNLEPAGPAVDGEVEDYAVTLLPSLPDFGDAPAPYPTTLAENGARHEIPNLNQGGFDDDGDGTPDDGDEFGPRLGSRDVEADGVHSDSADADDADGSDDEDGVIIGSLQVGQVGAFAQVHIESFDPSDGPQLDAWIDFNGDGDWNDAGERIADNVELDVSGSQHDHTIVFNVPGGAIVGTTFARFRLSTAGNLEPDGPASDGEVEDHQVTILGAAPVTLATEKSDKLRIRPVAGPDGPVNVFRLIRSQEVLVGTFAVGQQIVVSGLGGNDTIEVFGALSRSVTLLGGPGNDKLSGGDGPDTLEGGDGKDSLKGGGGDDTLRGGTGNDKLFGGIGQDTLLGELGADTLSGEFGNDTLQGGAGKDKLSGGEGGDTLLGGDDADTLDGGPGSDVLLGGSGKDNLKGGPDDDLLEGGSEDDKLDGGLGNDLLRGGEGKDNLKGDDGNDILLGEGGNDTLAAKLGFDLLIGGGGVDKLTGATTGNTILIGGETSHDANTIALLAVMAEWSRTVSGAPVTFAERLENLTNGGGENENKVLTQDTVFDDGVADTLKSSIGGNWVFQFPLDKHTGLKPTDVVQT